MDDKEYEEKERRRFEGKYCSRLCREFRESPVFFGNPNEVALTVIRVHLAQLKARGAITRCRPVRRDELGELYRVARGVLVTRYGERRVTFPEPALAVAELKEQTLARVKRNRADLMSALEKL